MAVVMAIQGRGRWKLFAWVVRLINHASRNYFFLEFIQSYLYLLLPCIWVPLYAFSSCYCSAAVCVFRLVYIIDVILKRCVMR